GGLSRINWLLKPPPAAVIVELGANDGLRGLDPASTRANIDGILKLLKRENIPVLLTGMQAPPNLGRDYGAEFNSIYPDMAGKYGAVYYPFFLEGVATTPELNQKDGIHPNARGVDIIVDGMLPSVRQLIEQIKLTRK
ncbi:MAG: arylesterase, partial [Rhodospirillaceae bacterium]|nr:arylesterase [Rhodospirillaceae bacterium]